MNKFLFSSLLEVVYREIGYITCNYNKEIIDIKDIKKVNDSDINNLKKSKALNRYIEKLKEVDFENSEYAFDLEFLNILSNNDCTIKNLEYVISYMNPYIKYYISKMKELIDEISKVLDIKKKEEGFIGEFPVYMKIDENNLIIERAIVSTNQELYLNKETNKFTYKVTYMDYDVPLENYKYKNKDLREMERNDIISYMDNSIKINLNNAKYYETKSVEIDKNNEELVLMNMGELSLWLDKKEKTYGGLKETLKSSLKRSLISTGIIVGVGILIILYKYFMKG